jgi:hypothetical protein
MRPVLDRSYDVKLTINIVWVNFWVRNVKLVFKICGEKEKFWKRKDKKWG